MVDLKRLLEETALIKASPTDTKPITTSELKRLLLKKKGQPQKESKWGTAIRQAKILGKYLDRPRN